MNYWNRALCSVVRRKGKSVILFAVIFILGNVIAGSIAIQKSTANVEKKIKHDLGATVSVEMDYEKMMEEGQSFSPTALKVDEVKKLGKSTYVKEFDYNVKTTLFVKKIKTYEMENATTIGGMPKSVTLKGNNLLEPLDFKDKKVNLVEGRTFKQEEINNGKDVAIISKKFAEANGFNVGDKVVLDSSVMDYKQDGSTEELASQDHPVEIIGIFEPTSVEKKKSDGKDQKGGIQEQFMETEQFNTIYMPNDAVMNINKVEFEKGKELIPDRYKKADGTAMSVEDMNQITPVYVLKSPEDIEAFKEESKSVVPDGYKLTASSDQYDQVGGTFKKMSQISGYVVLLAIGATLLIISLVVILFLRDRKHELGIYLSLGETRAKVMQQILIELLLISLVAMCLSLVTGNILGKMVSESLIASDAFSQTSDAASQGGAMMVSGGMNTPTLTTEDVSNAYEVKFSISYIVTFLIAGLSTVLLSAVLPLTYVLRLNPKKIMM
ncbi:ABC transporter permease [Enterococcus ureasiticus]|uniref:ABC transporter permease n=1 Tax=Enterococcus ureasiticus TaxID=903984 RepID=A0A1E5GG14_9ENTE|nr:ABC transporter permease [Enterococcus ureasiticus]OEG11664.1 ABC transporter permease [Enterococcus ureasiticus]